MILSYVHVLLSTQIAAIRDTRIQGKSRAIYFRTLRVAYEMHCRPIEGATHKYVVCCISNLDRQEKADSIV